MSRVERLTHEVCEHAFMSVVFVLIGMAAGVFGFVAYLHQHGLGLCMAILITALSILASIKRAAKCRHLNRTLYHETLLARGIWTAPPARPRFF